MSDPTPEPQPGSAAARRSQRGYVAVVVAAISFLALTSVAFLVPVPYVTMKPGPAFDTLGEMIAICCICMINGIMTDVRPIPKAFNQIVRVRVQSPDQIRPSSKIVVSMYPMVVLCEPISVRYGSCPHAPRLPILLALLSRLEWCI